MPQLGASLVILMTLEVALMLLVKFIVKASLMMIVIYGCQIFYSTGHKWYDLPEFQSAYRTVFAAHFNHSSFWSLADACTDHEVHV
jgi:hypothetical protein